jgi:hypothetical protein
VTKEFLQELAMKTRSRFFRATAMMSAALTAGLLLSSAQPAFAGASTGSWRYYPNGVYGGGYGRHHGYYGARPAYGYGARPAYGYSSPYGYGSPYAQPYYGNGYSGNGYYEPYYRERSDNGAAVAAGVMGLAAGAILGGALSQRSQTSGVSCTQYRSYNPRTGTFIGRNGVRYACR